MSYSIHLRQPPITSRTSRPARRSFMCHCWRGVSFSLQASSSWSLDQTTGYCFMGGFLLNTPLTRLDISGCEPTEIPFQPG